MLSQDQIIDWLLSGDVSIQFQVYRDLLDIERPDLRSRIEKEGWGARFLALRNNNGHWGRGFYQPKWTSSHYTLLDLKNLYITPDCEPIKETLDIVLRDHKGKDGGINPGKTLENSDVCVNGMALTYLCYFRMPEDALKSIVDFVLSQQMNDGGFNCESNMRGARHSSLHTTISILEGILEYEKNGYKYRLGELLKAAEEAREFILQHRLYRSDKTGEIIDRKMLILSWPSRWRYDILRALDYFQSARIKYDERMNDAIKVILKKRRKDNIWNLQANHPGQVHFEMETAGRPGRLNTLRALRVFRYFNVV